MTHLADEILVEKTLTGDDTAFGFLVLRHQQDIYQLALNYVKNPTDAEDLTQEIFIEAYTRLSTLQKATKFANWLRGITRNLSISWLRQQTHNFSYEELMCNGQLEVQITETTSISKHSPTPDESLEQKEIRQTILNAIETLSEKNRLVTKLHYLDGMSYREIAQHLNIPMSTIEGRLYRSRKQLKGEIIMTEEVRGEPKIEARLEEMQRQIADLQGQLRVIAHESDAFLDLQGRNEALKTVCRLPNDAERPIVWGYAGAYRPSPGSLKKRIAFSWKSIDSFLPKAPDAEIVNLARIFTNPTAIAVLRQLVEDKQSVADLAKESGVSENEINKAVESLIDAKLVARTKDNFIEPINDAIPFFLNFVSMTIVHLDKTRTV